MTPKGDLKNIFSPRNGVIQPSLFHYRSSPAQNRAANRRNIAETDKKPANSEGCECTYPVSSVCLEKNRKATRQ